MTMRVGHWFYKLPLRLRSLFRRERVERELSEELQFHLEQQIDDFVRKGMTPTQARYAALKAMDGVEQQKEQCRDARRVNWIEYAVHDLRYAIRMIRKGPGFAAAVIATLALGIGATTAIFSVVYAVVLRPLPFPEPERLVTLSTVLSKTSGVRGTGTSNYLDWRARNSVFEETGLIKFTANFNITGDGEPERVFGGRSTASVFRVLGVKAVLGRLFTEEDGSVEDKVVLSYGLWQRRYGGDPAILGKKIQMNGASYLVLGVMPRELVDPYNDYEVWTPLQIDPREARGTIDYACLARLKKGVTIEQANAEMAAIQAQLGKEHPEIAQWSTEAGPLLEDLVGNVRTLLYFLLGAVSCLLLIGCVNLANMFVARSVSRRQELVVRAALGAHKGRLVLQSVMEVAPLAVLGGLLGMAFTKLLVSLLVPLLPSTMPRLEAIRIDWQVLVFATVLLLATALLVGVWPGFRVLRWNINAALRDSGRASTGSGGATRLRSVLVVSQVAAVIVLMVVSALLIRSFGVLRSVDPGFRSEDVLSVHLAVSEAKYTTGAAFAQWCRRIVDGVSAIPGVVSAGMVNRLPLAGGTQTGGLEFEGVAIEESQRVPAYDWRTATPDYFKTLGIPLIEGRAFQETDTESAPRVVIVDERLARLAWPNQSPLGKRIRQVSGAPWAVVVGVVGHVRHDGLGVDRRPQVYWPYQQRRQPRMALAVRVHGDPQSFTRSVIAAIHEADPEQPVYDVRTMNEVVERSLSQQWLTMALLSLFASIALVLAAIGVYGVLSYGVSLRSREIGIRMALGSRRGQVIRMIVRQGCGLALIGVVIGLAGAFLLERILASFVYGITARDALSFASAAVVLFVVAAAASYIPARRAASVDPMSILRTE